jgi:Spy/CpxP family protein refolding chaperone
MKKIFITLLATAIFGITAFSQEVAPPTSDGTVKVQRPRLMEELGLTREQAQQIRKINLQRQPLMKQAQMQVRLAQKALDEAVYADVADENDIKEKVKEVQLAAAEVTKIKAFTEYSIRNVLTSEQLVKFRAVREKLTNLKLNRQEILQTRKPQVPNQRVINRAVKQ